MHRYSVVVVEDEPLILRSIKRSIEEAHSGFRIVGEATNGEDALSILEHTIADVVFTDIRMPVMDGLAFIERLLLRGNPTKIVILSGYKEFEYAKKAVRFGVEEYLLKPVSSEELSALLSRIYNELEENGGRMRRELLTSIVNSGGVALPDPATVDKELGSGSSFSSLLVCSGSSSKFASNWLTPAKDYWLRTDLAALVSRLLPFPTDHWVIDLVERNEKLVVIRNDSRPSYTSETLDALGRSLYEALNEEDFPVTVVIGKCGSSATDLFYVLQRLRIALAKSIVFGRSSLIATDSVDTHLYAEPLIDPNRENLFLTFIKNHHFEPFMNEFKSLLEEYADKPAPQIRLESLLKRIVSLFHDSNGVLSQNKLMETELEIDELISNAYRYSAIQGSMLLIIKDLFASRKKAVFDKTDHKQLIAQVEDYILHNYSRPISLQMIADHFGLVLPYLSSLFKKHKGVPPMEYMIQMRIEKAKELLRIYPPLTLKEIGVSIGYEDPYYMSRIFKLVTGLNPSEYRKQAGQT